MFEEMLPLCQPLEERGEDFLEQLDFKGNTYMWGSRRAPPDPTDPHSIAAALGWYSDGHVT